MIMWVIFGKDLVDPDLLFRSLRFTEKPKRVLGALDPNIRSCVESFAAGVNQYIQQAGKNSSPGIWALGV